VAHRGEKPRLAAAGRLGLFLGDAKSLIGRLAFALQRDAVETAVEHRKQRARTACLVEIIVGTAAQRLDGGFRIDPGRHQHADQLRLFKAQARDQIDPRAEPA
jgi:hypothetical protein